MVDLIVMTRNPPEQIDEMVATFEKLWEGEDSFRSGMILGIVIAEILNEGGK